MNFYVEEIRGSKEDPLQAPAARDPKECASFYYHHMSGKDAEWPLLFVCEIEPGIWKRFWIDIEPIFTAEAASE